MNFKSTYEEAELVMLLQQKDEQAFSYLYDNYAGALHTVVRQILPDGDNSEDVLQEVFVNIWRKMDMYDATKGRLFTWMLNVARNAAIDKLRSKHYQIGLKQQSLSGAEHMYAAVPAPMSDFGLKKVLGSLKEEQRQLIDLSYFQGFTHEQIAKALSIPLGTVKTRLRAALIQLRSLLGQS